ncbi:hypothetical protein QVD17_40727 [Tagetes erecta]|uniref:Uncharacterized protein n=1 Tax=Tagetes erecta TaxID=13708 RepID=A0AAD8NAY7_TARER|nr:hypothetical protein QVD17_40727 [Tagetes erecta]
MGSYHNCRSVFEFHLLTTTTIITHQIFELCYLDFRYGANPILCCFRLMKNSMDEVVFGDITYGQGTIKMLQLMVERLIISHNHNLLIELVYGRVSTKVDERLAYDTHAIMGKVLYRVDEDIHFSNGNRVVDVAL